MQKKFDRRTEKAIVRLLEGAVTKFSLRDVTHAVNKWNRERMLRAQVARERKRLRERLRELAA